mmetsp:Transcript_87784/g.165566  ORF Transcript_87784/g.165566 Transcript_87784/m.165566 type:complete len:285 (-) Transcript_87784:119-973(-)
MGVAPANAIWRAYWKTCLTGVKAICAPPLKAPTGTPWPRQPHASISEASLRGGGRLLFVGDVHGCVAELEALLEKVGFSPQEDVLVFLGDLVNKGPASGQVVRLARELGAWCVRGNHEDELLEVWYRVGRYAGGLKSYRHETLYQVTHDDVLWLQDLPLTLSLPWLSLVIVHAGLVPGVPLQQQSFKDMLWMRNCQQHAGGGWQALEKASSGVPWASAWPGPEHVIFGHDAKRRLQLHPFATGLDTGCCYGGSLTAILLANNHDWSAREFVSVPAAQVYEQPRG